MNARLTPLNEINNFLRKDEIPEAVIFGEWDYKVPSGTIHPPKNKLLDWSEAEVYLNTPLWSFSGTFGAPECFPMFLWTTQRVIYVSEYDGSTRLASLPRDPVTIHTDFV
jgi:hypothetical protein